MSGVIFYGWQAADELEPQLERLSSLAPGARALLVVDDAPSADLLRPLLREGDQLVHNAGLMGCGERQKAGYRAGVALGLDPLITLPRGLPAEVVTRLSAALHRSPVAIGVEAGRRGLTGVGASAVGWLQRRVAGLNLTGPASGCRGVTLAALAQVSWGDLSPGRVFDVELALALSERGLAIQEVPIPARKQVQLTFAAKAAQAAARAGLGRAKGVLAFPGPAYPPRGSAPSVQRGSARPLPRAGE